MERLDLNKVNFATNSIKDLLDARDAYHVHLMHKANVVATAVGLYRIPRSDPGANSPGGHDDHYRHRHGARRTLFDSVVKPWSWPCVLVFVDQWMPLSAFARHPDQAIPPALYLPDGRVVPTCIVTVDRDEQAGPFVNTAGPIRNTLSPGISIVSSVQGEDHIGTVGAIVTDGERYFALTNRHVAGPPGQPIFTTVRGEREFIGYSSDLSLGKVALSEAYAGWQGAETVINVDAALIELDNVAQWTPYVLNLVASNDYTEPGELVDIRTDSLTLNLIDVPVVAAGAASGHLTGTIAAFFYRYRAVGGREFVADFLIAPTGAVQTKPGDSGTMWCIDPTAFAAPKMPKTHPAPALPRPFAMQWGGHEFFDTAQHTTAQGFALASTVSTICRELDLDLIRSWDLQLPDYWGDVGHYSIAAKAIAIVAKGDAATFFQNNLDRISYTDDKLKPATFKGLSKLPFVPLADVPDKVWKIRAAGTRGGAETPNHFADMDKPDPKNSQTTLLDITSDGRGGTDKTKIRLPIWQAYYTDVADHDKGCLPFRVWQLFELMLAADNAADFLGYAGVLAHYVGDACQPLHISYMFNGIPKAKGTAEGDGVHSAYESDMVGKYAPNIIAALNKTFNIGSNGRGTPVETPANVATGEDAAALVVQLMRQTFATIKPEAIVDAYIKDKSVDNLWSLFGNDTIKVIAAGSTTLAQLYSAAWAKNAFDLKLDAVPEPALKALYTKKTWAPSLTLKTFAAAYPAMAQGPAVPAATRKR